MFRLGILFMVIITACLMVLPVSAMAATKTVKHSLGCVAGKSKPSICVGNSENGPSIGTVRYRLVKNKNKATLTATATYSSKKKGVRVAWILGIETVECLNKKGVVREFYSREVKTIKKTRKGKNKVSRSVSFSCPTGYRVGYMETVGFSAYSLNYRPRKAGEIVFTESDGEEESIAIIEPNQPNVDAYILPLENNFPSF